MLAESAHIYASGAAALGQVGGQSVSLGHKLAESGSIHAAGPAGLSQVGIQSVSLGPMLAGGEPPTGRPRKRWGAAVTAPQRSSDASLRVTLGAAGPMSEMRHEAKVDDRSFFAYGVLGDRSASRLD